MCYFWLCLWNYNASPWELQFLTYTASTIVKLILAWKHLFFMTQSEWHDHLFSFKLQLQAWKFLNIFLSEVLTAFIWLSIFWPGFLSQSEFINLSRPSFCIQISQNLLIKETSWNPFVLSVRIDWSIFSHKKDMAMELKFSSILWKISQPNIFWYESLELCSDFQRGCWDGCDICLKSSTLWL